MSVSGWGVSEGACTCVGECRESCVGACLCVGADVDVDLEVES